MGIRLYGSNNINENNEKIEDYLKNTACLALCEAHEVMLSWQRPVRNGNG